MMIWHSQSSHCRTRRLLQIFHGDDVILLLRLTKLFEERCFRQGKILSRESQMKVQLALWRWRLAVAEKPQEMIVGM
jgi:hypothetical protein